MTWERRYRFWHTARASLVLWGGLALAAGLLAARTALWLDHETGWHLYRFSPDGARAVLGSLVSSMLTFVVFVLSTTLIVVQLASGQLTPRVIALVLSGRTVKVALAALTFTYAYTLAALGRVEDRVPDLHVGIAVVLNLACIVLFFQFVQHLATGLRPGALVLLIGDRARDVIAGVYPARSDPARPEEPPRDVLPAGSPRVIEFAGRTGVVMAFGLSDLVRAARAADAVVELVPQVGDSVAPGDPLFRVFGGRAGALDRALRGCVAVGPERTLDQDPRFAFRMLVDIANKALSPAINDPTTAVLVLDQIDNLLLWLGDRRLDEGLVRDAGGTLRVVYGTPDWPDYVTLAVSEIRQYGEGSLQVSRRMRALLEHLIAALPPARHPPLQAELALLNSAVARKFPDEEDRRRAGVGDYQGVGGSDS